MKTVKKLTKITKATGLLRKLSTGFKHFNVPSASKLGPDSRSWDVQLAYRPWKWVELKERLEWNDKGMGNSTNLNRPHVDSVDGTTKKFLDGTVDRHRVSTLSASILWGPWMRAEAYARGEFSGGEQWETGVRIVLIR